MTKSPLNAGRAQFTCGSRNTRSTEPCGRLVTRATSEAGTGCGVASHAHTPKANRAAGPAASVRPPVLTPVADGSYVAACADYNAAAARAAAARADAQEDRDTAAGAGRTYDDAHGDLHDDGGTNRRAFIEAAARAACESEDRADEADAALREAGAVIRHGG